MIKLLKFLKCLFNPCVYSREWTLTKDGLKPVIRCENCGNIPEGWTGFHEQQARKETKETGKSGD